MTSYTIPVDPSGCAKKVIDVFGERGARWLEALPALIARYAEQWSLTILPPFDPLSYNYVAPVIRADGSPAALKAGVPCPTFRREIEALRLFDGSGISRLLEADADAGLMLLERLQPGAPLSSLDGDEARVHIAAGIQRDLCVLRVPAPEDHAFETLRGWASELQNMRRFFSGGSGPFPETLAGMAERFSTGLVESIDEYVLIHGDFHPDNILSAQRAPWLAIDPKGVVGEPAYDAAYFCMSYLVEKPEPRRPLLRRLRQFCEEAGLDQERVIRWGVVQGILCGWWSIEDHGGGYEEALTCAGIYAELL
jgi:streptomycin 6-kinase